MFSRHILRICIIVYLFLSVCPSCNYMPAVFCDYQRSRREGRKERETHGGPKSLAGVLMDVTMTTKDPLGEGGSERTSFELWKLVIRWRNYIQLNIKYKVCLELEIFVSAGALHLNALRVSVSLVELDELDSLKMKTN